MTARRVSGPAPVPIEHDEHLTSTLWAQADVDDEIVRYHDGDGWVGLTWRELAERVRSVATGLVASGVDRGDPVALMAPTSLDWTVVDLAILSTGAITVPIYDTDSADQCAWVLSNSRVRFAIAQGGDHAERIGHGGQEAADLADVLVIDEGGVDELARRGGDAEHDEVRRRLDDLDGDDVATIVYTSGTTGRPKGCVLTHGSLVWTMRQATHGLRGLFEDPDASTLLFLPLAHIFTRVVQFGCLDMDATVGYARSMDHVADDIASFRPTFLLSVPRVFEKVHNNARKQADGVKRRVFDFADDTAQEIGASDGPGVATRAKAKVADTLVYDKVRDALGGRVRHCVSGGAPLSDHLAHFFNAAGITILQGYGLTETSSVATVDRLQEPRVGTVGQPLPGVEIRIDDDGEILVRGPNVFRGYLDDDEATAEAVDDDGWLHTGDLGELDEDSYLRVTGRKKDLIVTAGGKNVAPEPLEERIKQHRLVAEPVLIGDQRPFVAALVTLDEEELRSFAQERELDGDLDELRSHDAVRTEIESAIEHANELVSRAESIREFRLLDREFSQDEGELTPTMKPRREVIAEHFADVLDDIYAA